MAGEATAGLLPLARLAGFVGLVGLVDSAGGALGLALGTGQVSSSAVML